MTNQVTFNARLAANVYTLAALQNPDERVIERIYKDREIIFSEELQNSKQIGTIGNWVFKNLTSVYAFFCHDTVHDMVKTIINEYLYQRSETNFNQVSSIVIANMKVEGRENPWITEESVKNILQELKQSQKETLLVADDFHIEVRWKIRNAVLGSSNQKTAMIFEKVFGREAPIFSSGNWVEFQRLINQANSMNDQLIENYLTGLDKSPENSALARKYANEIIRKTIENFRYPLNKNLDSSSAIQDSVDIVKTSLISEFEIYLSHFSEILRPKLLREFVLYTSRCLKNDNILDQNHPKAKEIIPNFLKWFNGLRSDEMQGRFYSNHILQVVELDPAPKKLSLLCPKDKATRYSNVDKVTSEMVGAIEKCDFLQKCLTGEMIQDFVEEEIQKKPFELYDTVESRKELLDSLIKKLPAFLKSILPPNLSLLFKKTEAFLDRLKEKYEFQLKFDQKLLPAERGEIESWLKRTDLEMFSDLCSNLERAYRLLESYKLNAYHKYLDSFSHERRVEFAKSFANLYFNLLIEKGSISDILYYNPYFDLYEHCLKLKKQQALFFIRREFIGRIPKGLEKPIEAILIEHFDKELKAFFQDEKVMDINRVDRFKLEYLMNIFLNEENIREYSVKYANHPEALDALKWLELEKEQSIPIYFLDFLYFLRGHQDKVQFIKNQIPLVAQLLSDLHVTKDQLRARDYYFQTLSRLSLYLKDSHFDLEHVIQDFLPGLRDLGISIPKEVVRSFLPKLPKIIELSNRGDQFDLIAVRKNLPTFESFICYFLWTIKTNKSLIDFLRGFSVQFLEQFLQDFKDPTNEARKALYKELVPINKELQSGIVGIGLAAVGFIGGIDAGVNFFKTKLGFEAKFSDKQVIGMLLGWANGLKNKFIPKTAPPYLIEIIDVFIHFAKGLLENHRLFPLIDCVDNFRSLMRELERGLAPGVKLDQNNSKKIVETFDKLIDSLCEAIDILSAEVKKNTFENNFLNVVMKTLKEFEIDPANPNYVAQIIERGIVPAAEAVLKIPGAVSSHRHAQVELTFSDEKRLVKY